MRWMVLLAVAGLLVTRPAIAAPSSPCAVAIAPAPADADELGPTAERAGELLRDRGWTPAASGPWTLALSIGHSGAKTALRVELSRGDLRVAESTGASVYAMPEALSDLLRRLLAELDRRLAEADWRAGAPPRIDAGPTDVPLPDGGEASLLPFSYDPHPVPAWRYDGCVAEGACASIKRLQPGCPDTPAVGMDWPAAATYCAALGLSVQTALQDGVIRDAQPLEARGDHLIDDDPTVIVTRGFRCVDVRDGLP